MVKLIGKCYNQKYILLKDSYENCLTELNAIKNGLTNNTLSTKLKYNHLTELYIEKDSEVTDEWRR